jgi:hypothetical protein
MITNYQTVAETATRAAVQFQPVVVKNFAAPDGAEERSLQRQNELAVR